MRTSAFSLREYARGYDALAVSFYGFRKVHYPRNLGTYAMDPRTGDLSSLVPRLIPQIPWELQINFIKSGISHEAGHLINRESLVKAFDLLQDKGYREGRNLNSLKHFHNVLVDIPHERCQAKRFSVDGTHFHVFWSHIEDNLWALKETEVVDEKGEKQEELTEEVGDLWDLQRWIMLTERNIEPHSFEFPERYKGRWDEIEEKVLPTLRKTYDAVKVLEVSKIFYDIVMEESPNMKEENDKKSKMKVKITKIKGAPAGLELDDEIDLSEIDPENIEVEEVEWDDFMESMGEEREEFQGKMVKNKNSDNFEEDLKESSSHEHFEGYDEGESRDKGKKGSGRNCPATDDKTHEKKNAKFDPPVHQGEGEKCVVNDFDVVKTAEKDRAQYQEAKNALTDFNRLSALLRKKLTAAAKDKRLRDQKDGRLDGRRLARVPTLVGHPEPPIFKKTVYSRSYKKTKVTLLIDESGSMSGYNKYYHARSAAILFAEILEKLGIDFEVIGFSTTYNERGEIPSCCNRHEPLLHIIYKKFREKLDKDRLGSISSRANNCDGESVLFAAQRLAVQQSDRKILFVFSDGYPAASTGYDMNEDLRKTVALCEINRMEVYGIGVCSTAVQDYYHNWIVIEDSRKLSQEFYKKLDEVLSKQR